MKKIVALILLICTLLFCLAACGGETRQCDACGKTKTCYKVKILGQEGWLCKDCENKIRSAGTLDILR